MKIAVLSNIHDHLANLEAVLAQVNKEACEQLLFLGDFCTPFSLAALANGFPGPIHAVFGNNDGDVFLLCKVASQHPHVTLHGQFAELELGGRKIAINHFPEISRRLAESQAYDAVFSGHDHQRYQHQLHRTLWANPGEIMGRFGIVSFGVYDTGSGEFACVEVSC
jgi:uncharacterized protein